MEAAGSLPSSSTSSAVAACKEWRAVAEHHHHHHNSGRSSADEVQQGREPADVNLCSITVDGGSENDIMHHRLHSVVRQREEIQQLEIGLKAQMIARSEIIEMQKSFDAQLKEHASLTAKFQEQIHEKDQVIRDLERKLEDGERELKSAQLDNEAAWAKDNLLREQDKELATFRRERDQSEVERAQLIKQIHELQEHIQDKERQLDDLQDKNRVAQDTILYKDEQLREAHTWIAQHQQVELLQSHELRERTDQCNHLWLECQRQYAELERFNFQMQKLQMDLADAGEKSGASANESQTSPGNSKETSQYGQNNGTQVDSNDGDTSAGNIGLHGKENLGIVSSLTSDINVPNQNDHVPSVQYASSSLLGLPPYIPTGQMAALLPFVMHQGVPQAPLNPQSNIGHFAQSSLHNWQQHVSEVSLGSMPNQLPRSQADHIQTLSDVKYNFEMPVNGQAIHSKYLDAHVNQRMENDPQKSPSTGEPQVQESIDRSYLASPQPEPSLGQFASQFNDALRLDSLKQTSEVGEQNILLVNHGLEGQDIMENRPAFTASQSSNDNLTQSVNPSESVTNVADPVIPDGYTSVGQVNLVSAEKNSESSLLDERSLLACIVRTIPAGGKIRISSTLPSRLGKMLAPSDWHDYKTKYGKLDDFVASHPELFVIEGDYIQLREGAQKVIAATAAIARVAAAAAAASPCSSYLPSVAVTPVAHAPRPKKVPYMNSNQFGTDNHPQLSAVQNQHTYGVYFGGPGSLPNVKILTKHKDSSSNVVDARSGPHSANMAVGNGADISRSSISRTQNKGSICGRPSSNYVAVQQHDRTPGAGSTSGR